MTLPEPYSSRESARQRLAVLAHGIRDVSDDDAAGRLLEMVAMSGDGELQALLLELGARSVVQAVRP